MWKMKDNEQTMLFLIFHIVVNINIFFLFQHCCHFIIADTCRLGNL